MEFDVNDFEPGDSFDVPPIYGSKLISAIMGIGGEVYLDGNTVVIVSLPGKTFAPPPPAPSISHLPTVYEKTMGLPVPFRAEPEPEIIGTPGIDLPETINEDVANGLALETSEEETVALTPTSLKRGRKPKAAAVEEDTSNTTNKEG